MQAYNDITPRVGVAYDVFGNGKTAIKLNWGRYLAYAANDSPYTSTQPRRPRSSQSVAELVAGPTATATRSSTAIC